MDATQIGPLCADRGWSRARLIAELRRAGQERNITLPGDDSLRRMVREWVHGRRGFSDFYAELFTTVFGVHFTPTNPDGRAANHASLTAAANGMSDNLAKRLDTAAAVDAELVRLLEAQTQNLRMLDRQLGARRLLEQTELHLRQMTDLMTYCVSGVREPLAAAAAEVAALAGWQALDLGDPAKAWRHHEVAKMAARDSGSPAIAAHVSAQQGYALIDVDRNSDAVTLVQHARQQAGTRVPAVLQSWLWAAEAEALASAGEEKAARTALDQASRHLPSDAADSELPYIVLDETHLRRWRGHCLARLGAAEAIEALSTALAALDPTFTRAAAALYCDLAMAHSVHDERDAALAAAERSREIASRTASARQQRRLDRLFLPSTSSRLTQRHQVEHSDEGT